MSKVKDLTDQRFGKLTVIKRVESDKKGNAQWLCQCDCGNEKVARADHLKSGNVRRFLNLEIREGKEYVYSLCKCVELNGEPCDKGWGG